MRQPDVLQARLQWIGPYRIVGVIGEGGMGVVYRAEHMETRERVALKTVRGSRKDELSSCRREIRALMRIRHPGIVRILEEGVESGLPWYAMELLEGQTLSDYNDSTWRRVANGFSPVAESVVGRTSPRTKSVKTSKTKDAPTVAAGHVTESGSWSSPAPSSRGRPSAAAGNLNRALGVIYRLCASLAFLHGEGIVHCDLKPSNIFIRTDGTVVLMDFGLVWQFGGAIGRESLELPAGVAGTPAYMSPEQIRGSFVDARTDLYAIGCILYELVVGRVPFGERSFEEVLAMHIGSRPAAPSELVEGVPEGLERLIMRLLEKQPRHRLGHAEDVMRALAALGVAQGLRSSEITPRAYVYRPELSGRDELLADLDAAIKSTQQRAGGCILIGGESGIGKTYFAAEVARRALDCGVEVVVGACLHVLGSAQEGLGSAPLYPFGRLLQAIGDRCVEHGPEGYARLLGPSGKVLAACEPGLARLPGHDAYPEPAELPAQAARDRLLASLSSVISAFVAEKPLLLILDDLQWADELSMRFLASLEDTYFDGRRVLILGTYRVEEKTEALSALEKRPSVRSIRLNRLDQRTVGSIVGDMLAMEAPPERLVEFLARRTEGNPFFVAEYLRTAVAEGILRRNERGQWQFADESGRYEALPLPGSLGALVGRRFDGLGPSARALLDAASVLGREVDRELLLALHASERDGALCLEELLSRQVLEQIGLDRYRFMHDKLCEIAYERMTEERRRELHGRAAVAIEARYAGTPELHTFYATLAHHFAMGEVTEKALEYLEKAGERALAAAAFGEAKSHFRKALTLDARRASEGAGSVGPRRLARWERRLGEACFGLGELTAFEEHLVTALRLLGYQVPSSRAGFMAALLSELTTQSAHLAGFGRGVEASPEGRDDLREIALAAAQMAFRYLFVNDRLALIVMSLVAVNQVERADPAIHVASPFAWLGYTAGSVRLHGLARSYFDRAIESAKASGDPSALPSVYLVEHLYEVAFGNWAAAEAIELRSQEILRDGVDPHQYNLHTTALGNIAYLIGRFASSIRHFEELRHSAEKSSNIQHVIWAIYGVARCHVAMGRVDEAIPRILEAKDLLAKHPERPSEIICHGLLAMAHLERGEEAEALRMADETADLIRSSDDAIYSTITGYVGAAEVYLALWERAKRGGSASGAGAFAQKARRLCADLKKFCFGYPFALPILHRYRGRVEHLSGQTLSAIRSLQKSLDRAQRFHMSYDEAEAHLALGRALPRLLGRDRHLAEAKRHFERLGCTHHVRQIA